MKKLYTKRFQKLTEKLANPELSKYARMENQNTFTRNRKMPLKDILLCCLAKKGLTTIFELRNYFQQKDGLQTQISKQAYLQQRKRLNPQIFSYLNDEYLMDFYGSDEPELWNSHLLVAIDGSKAEVPNSQENRAFFGNSGNQHSKEGQVRALVSGMYDILNGFYLDIQIASVSDSENELAKKNLNHLKTVGMERPVIAIFDRGYPSLELIDFLEAEGISYLFRLSCNDYKAERRKMKSQDGIVHLGHTSARLSKIRKKHPERYKWMKEKRETTARISRSILPSGQELVLLTDLPVEVTTEQLADLYYQRWEIEKKYHTLKNKLKFECVTGKASVYVYQDFYAQVLVYNMVQDIRRYADHETGLKGHHKKNKYPLHTNENIAIGLFKETMIKIFMEENPVKKEKLLFCLQIEMEKYVLPKRKLPGKERRKNISNKNKNNQKNSF